MFFIIGLIVVIGAVLGGYLIEHGKLSVLMAPLLPEGVILLGAALGSFLAGFATAVIFSRSL